MIDISHKSESSTTQTPFDAFLSNCDKSIFLNKINRTDYCWLWEGHKTASGYGFITYKRTVLLAHRLSYAIFKGEFEDRHVLHRCDYRDCVNPEHLFLGTQSENARDMHNKGRNSWHIYRSGEDAPASKLKDLEVIFIYRHSRAYSSVTLARRFNVTEETIRSIRSGRNKRLKTLLTISKARIE